MRAKKRFLVVCAHPPAPNATQAGHKVAYHFIRELALEHDVDLLLLINKGDAQDIRMDGMHLGVVKVVELGLAEKLRGCLAGWLRGVPLRFATRLSGRAVAAFRQMLAAKNYDGVRFEFSQVASLVECVDFHGEKVASLHDLQIQVALRSNTFYDRLSMHALSRYEHELMSAMNRVLVLSQKDADIARSLYGVDNVSVVPPALSDFVYGVDRSVATIERHTLLFWGAMNRRENEEAVLFFLKNVLPVVKKFVPDVRIYVVGNAPSDRLQALASEAIVVTGFVEDPSSYFRASALGVVPLLSGAGVKIKTLEMLQAGIPVISTPVGAEGISADGLRVVHAEEMANAVLDFFGVR